MLLVGSGLEILACIRSVTQRNLQFLALIPIPNQGRDPQVFPLDEKKMGERAGRARRTRYDVGPEIGLQVVAETINQEVPHVRLHGRYAPGTCEVLVSLVLYRLTVNICHLRADFPALPDREPLQAVTIFAVL